ncbi:H(+)/Cl(-) exchange transporter 5 [Galendromus occidentalis]|uniref:Chloride channel protein n=1 Tax=Galendromus occidentalis TaxID=34638 RepID=A0AAJ6VWX1_9ACAR|nr:H(+)/Cl(-) exchange transporter 5 [Galendromus occidentalis]
MAESSQKRQSLEYLDFDREDDSETYGGTRSQDEPAEVEEPADPLASTSTHYDDFHTIDWQRDIAAERQRHRVILKRKGTLPGLLLAGFDACSGWLCVLIVGVLAGFIAGVIDIGAAWMKDLREGVCPDAFWLNKEQCCWSSNETSFEGETCDQWRSWPSTVFTSIDTSGGWHYILAWLTYLALSILMAGSAAQLVKTFAPYASGSGIPEIKTILSGFVIRGYLGKWTLLIKSVGLVLAVGAGLSLGKEGPLVHVACCIGNIVAYAFPKYGKNEAKKREILSAAAAAGVSVAFGAPIGGVLFSLEEVSYYFPLKTLWRSFFCALVAASVLRSINPFGNDHLVMFSVKHDFSWSSWELLPFLLLGVLGGIIGTVFTRLNLRWCKFRKESSLGHYPIFEVLAVAAVTALFSFPNLYTRMNTSDLIKLLFVDCGIGDRTPLCDYKRNFTDAKSRIDIAEAGDGVYTAMWELGLAFVLKIFITVFTFGMKVPAGIFIPSLAMGAIIGRAMGVAVEQAIWNHRTSWLFNEICASGEGCIPPGLYAMVGAAACLGGVTRMTVSLVVIMFELTGSVKYILPLMTAIMAAKWVADALNKEGIYDAHIGLNNYPFLDTKEEFHNTSKAGEVMRPQPEEGPLKVLLQEGLTVDQLTAFLGANTHNGFPVVVSETDKSLIGFVKRKDLTVALTMLNAAENIVGSSPVVFSSHPPASNPPPLKLRRYLDMAPLTVTEMTPMETVVDMFRKLGVRHVLVTSNGTIRGVITKKDVLRYVKTMKGEYDGILINHRHVNTFGAVDT